MLHIPSDQFPLLGGDEKRPTVLCMVATALPAIRVFHLPITVKSEPVYYCYSFS